MPATAIGLNAQKRTMSSAAAAERQPAAGDSFFALRRSVVCALLRLRRKPSRHPRQQRRCARLLHLGKRAARGHDAIGGDHLRRIGRRYEADCNVADDDGLLSGDGGFNPSESMGGLTSPPPFTSLPHFAKSVMSLATGWEKSQGSVSASSANQPRNRCPSRVGLPGWVIGLPCATRKVETVDPPFVSKLTEKLGAALSLNNVPESLV